MQYIVILDTETTGLDAAKGKIIEIAAILYHIPTRSIISQASTLCRAEENPVFDINGISVASLHAIPAGIQNIGLTMIADMLIAADAVVAHNAAFDKRWLDTIPDMQIISRNKKWICTKNDVTWPIRKGVALNLVHICVALNVPVVSAHRALQDCLLLLRAIEQNPDIESFLDKNNKGRETYRADITYEERQLVKEMGFQWDNLMKVWTAKLTPEQAAQMPFKVYLSTPIENV